MFNWLRILFGVCNHKWKIIKEHNIVQSYAYVLYQLPRKIDPPINIGRLYIQQCEKCGIIKHYKVNVE